MKTERHLAALSALVVALASCGGATGGPTDSGAGGDSGFDGGSGGCAMTWMGACVRVVSSKAVGENLLSDGKYVWLPAGPLQKVPVTGGTLAEVSGTSIASAIAMDAKSVYGASSSGDVWKADKGTGVTTVLASGVGEGAIATDGTFVFVLVAANQTIAKVPVVGGAAQVLTSTGILPASGGERLRRDRRAIHLLGRAHGARSRRRSPRGAARRWRADDDLRLRIVGGGGRRFGRASLLGGTIAGDRSRRGVDRAERGRARIRLATLSFGGLVQMAVDAHGIFVETANPNGSTLVQVPLAGGAATVRLQDLYFYGLASDGASLDFLSDKFGAMGYPSLLALAE